MFRFSKKKNGDKPRDDEGISDELETTDDILSDDVLSDLSDELSALEPEFSSSDSSDFMSTADDDDDTLSDLIDDDTLSSLDVEIDDKELAAAAQTRLSASRRFSEDDDFDLGSDFASLTELTDSTDPTLGDPTLGDPALSNPTLGGAASTGRDLTGSGYSSAYVPAYPVETDDKLVPSSRRLTELEGFSRNARSAAGQVGMAVQSLGKSHDALVNLTAFLPSIEAEFHRAEVLANEIKGLHNDNATKDKQISDLQSESSVMKKEIAELRDVKAGMTADLENLKSEMSQYSITVAQLKKANSGLESDIAFERKKNASLSDQLERQGSDISALESRNSELLSEIELVGKNEASIRREYDELNHRLDHESSARQAIAIEHEKLKRDSARWRKELEELEGQQEAIAGKMRAIEEDAKVRESRAQGEIFILKSETENLQSKLRLRDANEKTLQAQISEVNQALRNADGAAKRARRELDEKQAELERSKKEIAELNTNLSEINLNYMSDLITLDNQKQQIEQFRQSLQALNQQNQKLAQYQSLYRSAEEQISQMQTKISEYSRELKAAKLTGINQQVRSGDSRYSTSSSEDVTIPGPTDNDSKH